MSEKKRSNAILKWLWDIVVIAFAAAVYSLGLVCFISPNHIAPGGATGIAIIISGLTDINVGLLIAAINIPLLIVGFILLNKKTMFKTLISVALITVMTDYVLADIPVYIADGGTGILAAVFGGVLMGAGIGLTYAREATSGGTDIVAKVINRFFPDFKLGTIQFIADAAVVLAGLAVYRDLNVVLYAIISIFVQAKLVDMLVYGSMAQIQFGGENETLVTNVLTATEWAYATAEAPRPLDHEPKVSIVIACPNRSWMLDECLKAIGGQTYRNFETIVLPDAEEEMETDVAAAARLAVIPTGKVRPAEKRNLGIARAKGEIVAFIDDDAYPDAKWLEYAVRYFTEPSVGAVGGPGVTPPNDGFLERMSGRVYDCRMVSGGYKYRYRAGGVRRDVDDYPSCNLFVRRDVLEKIGGYRTDFWPGEDTLLCKDIVDKGFRIVYDPWVVVYHHRRRLFGPHLRQLGRYAFHRGYFVKRFPSNSARLSYFIPSALTVYLALLGFASAVAVSMSFDAAVPLWYARTLAVASVPAALYLALALVSSFSFNPAVWLLTLLGIISTHVVYGLRFIGGLSAAKAPCQYIGKDHA